MDLSEKMLYWLIRWNNIFRNKKKGHKDIHIVNTLNSYERH